MATTEFTWVYFYGLQNQFCRFLTIHKTFRDCISSKDSVSGETTITCIEKEKAETKQKKHNKEEKESNFKQLFFTQFNKKLNCSELADSPFIQIFFYYLQFRILFIFFNDFFYLFQGNIQILLKNKEKCQ